MSTVESALDTRRIDPEVDLAGSLLRARHGRGKSYLSAIREIRALAKGVGKITPSEYFYYGLDDDSRWTSEEKAAFLGKEAVRAFDALVLKNAWQHIAADKLVLYATLMGAGLPVPETLAVYHRFRRFGAVPCLRGREEAAEFLRQRMPAPFFGKPNGSSNSLGVAPVERYDAADDALVLANGRRVTVSDFVVELDGFAGDGYIFQERLRPHPRLCELTGARMSSFRLYVVIGEAGPELLRASWKIATGDNLADNFWRPGNLLAAIDVANGRIGRVVGSAVDGLKEIEAHPDSGVRLQGVTLPEWQAVTATTLAAAATLPGCLVQGWDVAVTERGPVLIEVEGNGGHPQMVQAAHGSGLYAGRYKAFFDRHQARRAKEDSRQRGNGLAARLRRLVQVG